MKNRKMRILYQELANAEIAQPTEGAGDQPTPNTKVKDTEFGEVHRGVFGITVKNAKGEELYKNDKEPFEYEVVNSIQNVLRREGANLDDTQVDFIGQALAGSEETGKAVLSLIGMYNDRTKANAKSSAYAQIQNKYKPLEGEDRETAIAKTIRGTVKLSGLPVESVIEMLKNAKAVPQDYTVADYNATPLRRVKGDSDDE